MRRILSVVSTIMLMLGMTVGVHAAGDGDIILDGNTSEDIWYSATSGIFTPSAGEISYISYQYVIDDAVTRMYLAIQYIDESGAASNSKAVVKLSTGQTITLAADNTTSNAQARYKSKVIRNTDVTIETEITANIRAANSISITVYDSTGRSSGTHWINLDYSNEEPTTVRPTTTSPQRDPEPDNEPQQSQPPQIDHSVGDSNNYTPDEIEGEGGVYIESEENESATADVPSSEDETHPDEVSDAETAGEIQVPRQKRSVSTYILVSGVILGAGGVTLGILAHIKKKK